MWREILKGLTFHLRYLVLESKSWTGLMAVRLQNWKSLEKSFTPLWYYTSSNGHIKFLVTFLGLVPLHHSGLSRFREVCIYMNAKLNSLTIFLHIFQKTHQYIYRVKIRSWGVHIQKLYEQVCVNSESTRRAGYGYIGHSARWVAKSRTRSLGSLKFWQKKLFHDTDGQKKNFMVLNEDWDYKGLHG